MASRAGRGAKLPGPPQQTDLAYLAALLDRGALLCARDNSLGLRVTGSVPLRHWLSSRFGGWTSGRTWHQTHQSTVRYLLMAVRPYVVVRSHELEAMMVLLDHLANRGDYRGDVEWQAERTRLIGRVGAARAAVRASGSSVDAR